MNVYQGMRVKGFIIVTKNGKVFTPERSMALETYCHHFDWTADQGGAARQLALAILMEELPPVLAEELALTFAREVLTRQDPGWFLLTTMDIAQFLHLHRNIGAQVMDGVQKAIEDRTYELMREEIVSIIDNGPSSPGDDIPL